MNEVECGIPGQLKKTSFLEPHLLLDRVEAGGPTLGATLSLRLHENPPQTVEIAKITDTAYGVGGDQFWAGKIEE